MDLYLENVRRTYRFWGRHPQLYRFSTAITLLGRERELRRLAVGKLKLEKGDTALDLACGTGLNFRYLQERVGSTGRVIAFDCSEEMLSAARRRARETGWENVEFVQGDAAELYLECSVDGVLSTLGMSAMPEHRKALERALAILRYGGRISILDARFPHGALALLNPLLVYICRRWACWDHTKDIPSDLREVCPGAKVEEHNFGTMYIAYATKE